MNRKQRKNEREKAIAWLIQPTFHSCFWYQIAKPESAKQEGKDVKIACEKAKSRRKCTQKFNQNIYYYYDYVSIVHNYLKQKFCMWWAASRKRTNKARKKMPEKWISVYARIFVMNWFDAEPITMKKAFHHNNKLRKSRARH